MAKDLTPKQVAEIAKKAQNNPPCPSCGIRNGHKAGCKWHYENVIAKRK